MCRLQPVWLAASLGLAAASLLAEAPPAGQTRHLRPDRSRQELDLAVAPGNRVKLEAGGCVRGADGVALPLLAPDRSQDQGLIFIPGVTMAFTPVADLVGSELVVPRNLDYPGSTHIWIDWGRYDRSPLESPEASAPKPVPCADASDPARLNITVEPGSGTERGAAGTMTLELARYDSNRIPLNPGWAGGERPVVCAACDGFRIERRQDGSPWVPAVRTPRCSLQKPAIDAGCSPHRSKCPLGPNRGRGRDLSGHVNWGPATFTGRVSTVGRGPVHIALDGDAGLFFETDGAAGVIRPEPGSRYETMIGVEFSTAQTVRWFRTPWWKQLPFRVASYRPISAILGKPNRHEGEAGPYPALDRRPATVIGLFGIDNAHDPHPELHPVYGIAIQTEATAAREVWQVFARSWGTEGDCGGRRNHATDLSSVRLVLAGAGPGPWEGAEGVFFDHGIPFRDWTVFTGSSGSPSLMVELPRGRHCSIVEGELTLLARKTAEAAPLRAGDPPPGEPVRWSAVPGGEQLCTSESWFLPVP